MVKKINAPCITEMPPKIQGLSLLRAIPGLVQDPFKTARKIREQYGDIYTLDLGISKVIVMNHPYYEQYVLREKTSIYGHRELNKIERALMQNSLLVSSGETWRQKRRMMQPYFHQYRLANLTSLMVAAIDESLATWQAAAKSLEPLDLVASFDDMTINVLVRTLFGAEIDSKESIVVSTELRLVLKYIFGSILMQLFLGCLPDWFPVPGERRYQQAIQKISRIIRNLIKKCRENNDKEDNLLSMMIHRVDDVTEKSFNEQELYDETLTIFLAGYETTSTALTWSLYLLLEHPYIFQKVQTEVDTVLSGRLPTINDLPNLSYTLKVIQETLRMYPPASFLTRQAKETDQLDGYCIPESTLILISIYMIHHHPEIWDNPDKFDPDRFNSEQVKQQHRSAWIPFGDGQRFCIGKDFALIEAQLALAIIVQRYEISRVSGKVVKQKLSYITKPSRNILVTLKER